MFTEIINYVKNYYRASRLPSKLTPSLMRSFLLSSNYSDVGFTRKIYPTKLKLVLEDSPFTDGSTFYYPVSFLEEQYFDYIEDLYTSSDYVNVAIALFNGIAVHEAAHCKLITDFYENEISRRSYGKNKSEVFNKKYMSTAFNHLGISFDFDDANNRQKIALMSLALNITEDMYIERCFVPYYFSWANKFLSFATDIYFDRLHFNKLHEKSDAITIADIHFLRSNDTDFVNELCEIELISNAKDIFSKLKSNSKLADRAIVAAEIYQLMANDMEQNPDNYQNNDSFDEAMMQALQQIKELLQKIASGELSNEEIKNLLKVMGEGNGEFNPENTSTGEHLEQAEIDDINKESEETEQFLYKEFLKQQQSDIWQKDVVIEDVLEGKHFKERNRSSGISKNTTIKFLPYLKNLAGMFKYAKHGKIRNYRHLESGILDDSNLHNIALGNVFRTVKQERHVRNKAQVVIMVDLSGSTNSLNGSNMPLFQEELNLSYSMQKLLTASNIPNVAYGHTTYHSSNGYSSEIAGLGCFEMPYVNTKGKIITKQKFEERYNKMLVAAGLYGNADGYALRFASEQFDFSKKQTKVLIMINDGLPAEATWGGYTAESELKESIELVRKKGIVVLAFAATEKVVEDLIPLYGEEFVVKAYGQNSDKEAGKILNAMIPTY